MISPRLAGALILGLPLVLLAWLALRRQPRAIFLFAIALIVVGLGYLMATGATEDIARRLVPTLVPAKT
jgi:dipeptide/tripeptide permease